MSCCVHVELSYVGAVFTSWSYVGTGIQGCLLNVITSGEEAIGGGPKKGRRHRCFPHLAISYIAKLICFGDGAAGFLPWMTVVWWGHLGQMFGVHSNILGPCSPILGLCWCDVGPIMGSSSASRRSCWRRMRSLAVFRIFCRTFISELALKTLPPSGLRGPMSIHRKDFSKTLILPEMGIADEPLNALHCGQWGFRKRFLKVEIGVVGTGPAKLDLFQRRRSRFVRPAARFHRPVRLFDLGNYIIVWVRWYIFEVDKGKRKREGKEEESGEGERKWKDSMNDWGQSGGRWEWRGGVEKESKEEEKANEEEGATQRKRTERTACRRWARAG